MADQHIPPEGISPQRRLDIRGETCPMTFVRTRLMLDRMAPGEVLEVLYAGEEPARNLPRTAAEQGHAVLLHEPGRLLLRKG
ncbi:MAG: sulfurtransferase TusA family protein [Rhodovarius sp.]|nr:sulfurtransferase TusA family protein [Rhodovarius sp.]MCX7931618.1 sulfurtransferase TusA family protein [Rhodovarius sp.]MDW8314377.1 sulfurtransferase TusA family protein [Rhodovarius sp.]